MKISNIFPAIALATFPQKANAQNTKALDFFDWQSPRDPQFDNAKAQCLASIETVEPQDLFHFRGKSEKVGSCDSFECVDNFLKANRAILLHDGGQSNKILLVIKQSHITHYLLKQGLSGPFFSELKNYEKSYLHQLGIFCFLNQLYDLVGKSFIGISPESARDEKFRTPYSIMQKYLLKSEARQVDLLMTHMHENSKKFSFEKIVVFDTAANIFPLLRKEIAVLAHLPSDCLNYVKAHATGDVKLLGMQALLEIYQKFEINIQRFNENDAIKIKNFIRETSIYCRDKNAMLELIDSFEHIRDDKYVKPQISVYVVGSGHNISAFIDKEVEAQQFKGKIYEIPLGAGVDHNIIHESAEFDPDSKRFSQQLLSKSKIEHSQQVEL